MSSSRPSAANNPFCLPRYSGATSTIGIAVTVSLLGPAPPAGAGESFGDPLAALDPEPAPAPSGFDREQLASNARGAISDNSAVSTQIRGTTCRHMGSSCGSVAAA